VRGVHGRATGYHPLALQVSGDGVRLRLIRTTLNSIYTGASRFAANVEKIWRIACLPNNTCARECGRVQADQHSSDLDVFAL
jgi:hypothetical protein